MPVSQKHTTLPRRRVLQMLGAAAACPICTGLVGRAFATDINMTAPAPHGAQPMPHGAAAPAPAAHGPAHWEYDGAAGPDHWGQLSPDFQACAIGREQSPIDLRWPIPTQTGHIETAFREMPLRIVNNGHTIQVNCAPGSQSRIDGVVYDLLQFHFHHPSEHLLSGKRFDMECHFVHKSAAGGLAVLGVFIQPGAENMALKPVFDAMPAQAGPEMTAAAMIRPEALLPVDRHYFRYAGSLTTPPCSEGIVWSVYRQPVEASAAQIKKFAQLFAGNARPVQPQFNRYLLEAL